MTDNQKNQIYLKSLDKEISSFVIYFKVDILKDSDELKQHTPFIYKIGNYTYTLQEMMEFVSNNANRDEILFFKVYELEQEVKRLKLTTKQLKGHTFFNLDFQTWRSKVYK